MPTSNITLIIRKIFDDYDEKNGAQQKTDYTQRAENIVQTWTQSIAKEGLTTQLICELHRLVCEDEWIPINDPKGGIAGFAKSGEYRTFQSFAPSRLIPDHKGYFVSFEQIPILMKRLVETMQGVLGNKPNTELMIENILAFSVEFMMIHPFANENGRIRQLLMELLAFQVNIKPFHISYIIKLHNKELTKAVEAVPALQNVAPLWDVLLKHSESASIEFEKYCNAY